MATFIQLVVKIVLTASHRTIYWYFLTVKFIAG